MCLDGVYAVMRRKKWEVGMDLVGVLEGVFGKAIIEKAVALGD